MKKFGVVFLLCCSLSSISRAQEVDRYTADRLALITEAASDMTKLIKAADAQLKKVDKDLKDMTASRDLLQKQLDDLKKTAVDKKIDDK